MSWLLLGVLYSFAYVIAGWALRDQPLILGWFRAAALLVPPMTGTFVIVRRRQSWSGCQWLFWATIALGLAMSAIGLTGWAADAGLPAGAGHRSGGGQRPGAAPWSASAGPSPAGPVRPRR